MSNTPAWQLESKNAKVATWMGWLGVGKRLVAERGTTSNVERWMGLSPRPDAMSVTDVPHYCTSWEDWVPVQVEITKRGLGADWLNALIPLVCADFSPMAYDIEFEDNLMRLLNSTQEQRVDALLAIIKEP